MGRALRVLCEGLFREFVMAVCEFNELYCVYVCEGSRGVVVWFGTPNMQRIYGLNLAWHWRLVCGHVHSISHSKTVCSWFVLLKLPAFLNVWYRVCLLACNV